jgi:hypothetical protein
MFSFQLFASCLLQHKAHNRRKKYNTLEEIMKYINRINDCANVISEDRLLKIAWDFKCTKGGVSER